MSEERKDVDMYDEDVYLGCIDAIPDETLTLVRTKSGTVSLNRRGIYNLAARGFSAKDMADIFGVEEKAIYTNFSVELKSGKGLIGPRLKTSLIRNAMSNKPNPALLLFALKNWTELTEEGMKGQTIEEPPKFVVEPPKFEQPTELTDSEREELDNE